MHIWIQLNNVLSIYTNFLEFHNIWILPTHWKFSNVNYVLYQHVKCMSLFYGRGNGAFHLFFFFLFQFLFFLFRLTMKMVVCCVNIIWVSKNGYNRNEITEPFQFQNIRIVMLKNEMRKKIQTNLFPGC